VIATLRPGGKVIIHDKIYDAISSGGFIEKGTNIIVTGYDGGMIIVQAAKEDESSRGARNRIITRPCADFYGVLSSGAILGIIGAVFVVGSVVLFAFQNHSPLLVALFVLAAGVLLGFTIKLALWRIRTAKTVLASILMRLKQDI